MAFNSSSNYYIHNPVGLDRPTWPIGPYCISLLDQHFGTNGACHENRDHGSSCCATCEDCMCRKTGFRQILTWIHLAKRLLLHNSDFQKPWESWHCEGYLQVGRKKKQNKKNPYSPLGRLAKRLTSISLVLLAGSSFSSKENSFWKLRGAGKIPTVIEMGLSCGKLDLFMDRQCKQLRGAHWMNLSLIIQSAKSLKQCCWKQNHFEWCSRI